MNKKTIEDIAVKGKRVLVRCDFNVPQDSDGNITDDRRIRGALPTIEFLRKNGARVILMSHLGRPKGDGFEEKYSLKPVAVRLSELLKTDVKLAGDGEVVGENAVKMAAELNDGDVLLLENVRFVKGETKNDKEFAKN